MKTKPRQVILDVSNWILESKEERLSHNNTLNYILNTLDNDPAKPKIPCLKSNITPLKTRIVDLTDKIGVGYFTFDPPIPYTSDQNKNQLSSNPNLPRNKNRESHNEKAIPIP